MTKYVIGIDLGATSIKYTVMAEDGVRRTVNRVATRSNEGPDAVLDQIHTAVENAKEELSPPSELLGIGLGTPGLIGTDGNIIGEAVNIPGWHTVDLLEALKKREKTEVAVQNDGNLAAFGEIRYGAGRGIENAVCISLGTGIGGGFVVNGSLCIGEYGYAGEFGHLVVEPGGEECGCGQKGCVERYSSERGMVTNCIRLAQHSQSALADIARTAPENITADIIYTYLEKGDPLAREVHLLSCRMLARAIGILINLLAPGIIIFCGGVIESGHLILPDLLQMVPENCMCILPKRCDLVVGSLKGDAGVIGAAAFALTQFLP